MRFHSATCALALAMSVGVFAQNEPGTLAPTRPSVTVNFDKAAFVDAITTLGERSGIAIQFADGVLELQQSMPVTARFVRARFLDALTLLLKERDLTYKVVDPKTVRIEPKTP